MEAWTPDTYPYRGVELKPQMLCELAERQFPASAVLQRRWLISEAPRIHEELGGKPTSADPISQAKKARSTLLTGDWEEAGFGSIRRVGAPSSIVAGEIVDSSLVESINELYLDAEEWFGTGDETVYCYTFPSLVELAKLKGDKMMPMKIGKTSFPSLDRVSLQCGVSNPERPVVPLAIRVENSALYERALHRVLTIWNRWIDDAPGSEWFKTSKTEILSIVHFLNNPPEGADVKKVI